jgi:hypothetical protein
MKSQMNNGKNFQDAHNIATNKGFPAKRRGIGLTMPSTKTLGFGAILFSVVGGSYYFYQRRNLRDEMADEEDDSE